MSETPDFQILSLSGGGARGLYTIAVLAGIEEHLAEVTNKDDYWIGKHFDLICGTSVGGLLALGLASGKTARELLTVMEKALPSIFPKISDLKKFLLRFYRPIFNVQPLETLLDDLFKEQKIGDISQTRVLIPTINYTKGGVQVFKTPHHPNFASDYKVKIKDVALATSAAPTYFKIHEFSDNWYVDGGLAANSPGVMGIHEALGFLEIDREQLRVLIVGTMGEHYTANQKKSRNRGYHGWGYGERLIGLTMAANEGLHNDIATHMVDRGRLLKLDTPPSDEQTSNLKLDKATPAAMSTLRGAARNKVQEMITRDELTVFFKHTAQAPKLYYGPHKPTDGDC